MMSPQNAISASIPLETPNSKRSSQIVKGAKKAQNNNKTPAEAEIEIILGSLSKKKASSRAPWIPESIL